MYDSETWCRYGGGIVMVKERIDRIWLDLGL